MKFNRKNKLLLLGFILVLYICYSFAISNTIGYYKEYKTKEELLFNEKNIPKLLNQLIYKEKQLDQVLSQSKTTASESFQSYLLQQLTAESDNFNLKIIDFQEPHYFTDKGFVTTSYVFSLEGSFNGCLALLNKMENNPAFGNIQHLNFTKTKNYKTNMDRLIVQVIMQKIR